MAKRIVLVAVLMLCLGAVNTMGQAVDPSGSTLAPVSPAPAMGPLIDPNG